MIAATRLLRPGTALSLVALLLQACAAPPPPPPDTSQGAGFSRAMAAYRVADYDTALTEFRPLAEGGMAAAQFRLGTMYENGRGLPRDLDAARDWYTRAAAQGYSGALYSLGYVCYIEADGACAVEWWTRAAARASADAMFSLGVLYDEGTAMPRDPVQAHMWYDLAAAAGAAGAAEKRDALARGMSATEVAEARTRARAWQGGAGASL
jgi:localization factor PodJL